MSELNEIISDATERKEALDPTRSFIVQAPAGSGKTGLLIKRYLSLLAHVKRPEEIVALTFTRKAAGEMRRRIVDALTLAACGAHPDSAHELETFVLATAALKQSA
ncbi:MAG: UvrD-helicase domain-containing protein, partial [Thermodesulfobacteriota bacterium]